MLNAEVPSDGADLREAAGSFAKLGQPVPALMEMVPLLEIREWAGRCRPLIRIWR